MSSVFHIIIFSLDLNSIASLVKMSSVVKSMKEIEYCYCKPDGHKYISLKKSFDVLNKTVVF